MLKTTASGQGSRSSPVWKLNLRDRPSHKMEKDLLQTVLAEHHWHIPQSGERPPVMLCERLRRSWNANCFDKTY
jgi:hypothetical protein